MKRLVICMVLLTNAVNVLGADTDLDVYGKINLGIWYFSPQRYYDDTSLVTIDTIIGNDTIKSVEYGQVDSMDLVISNWIPFGAFGVKYNGDKFGVCVQMGTRLAMDDYHFNGSFSFPKTQKDIRDYITLSKWYIEWYINDNLTLLAGKNLAPTNFFPSNQLFFGGYGFNNTGCLSTGAYPMFQLTIASSNENVKGKLAVIKVDTTAIAVRNSSNKGDDHQCSVKIPKLEGGFSYSFEKGIFSTYGNFAGGFQTYEVVLFQDSGTNMVTSVPDKDDRYLDITSYVIGGDIGFSLGPVSISVDALYGQNLGIYGAFVGDQFGYWRTRDYMTVFFPYHSENPHDSTGWVLLDGTAFEIATVLKIKPKEFISFEGGVGMVFGDHEFHEYSVRFENSFAWYFQTELTVFETLKFTPEVGEYNFGPLKYWGRYFYWGMNMGIDF